jgi:hypothetical protein
MLSAARKVLANVRLSLTVMARLPDRYSLARLKRGRYGSSRNPVRHEV